MRQFSCEFTADFALIGHWADRMGQFNALPLPPNHAARSLQLVHVSAKPAAPGPNTITLVFQKTAMPAVLLQGHAEPLPVFDVSSWPDGMVVKPLDGGME